MRVSSTILMLLIVAGCSDASGPSKVASSAPVRQVSSAGDVSCAVTADSAGWCWGAAIGPRPVRWAAAYKLRYVSVGATPSGAVICAVTGDRHPLCQGTLAVDSTGTFDLGATPTLVAADTMVDTIAVGASHFCGVNAAHTAWCWGDYGAGVRGDSVAPGTRNAWGTPTPVAGGATWAGVAAGVSHSCGMATDRKVFCWGTGREVGVPDSSSYDTSTAACGRSVHGGAPCTYIPRPLTTVPAVSGIVSAGTTTCALTTAGTVWCWGYVGPTAGKVSQVPVAMPLSTTAIAVSVGTAGGYCIIATAGDAYCNDLGSAPALVPGGLRYTGISTGSDHACAIGVGGYLYCWGSNGSGQLGVGDSTSRGTPTQVVIPVPTP